MRFRVLGPLELWDGMRRMPLGSANQRAVLAMLLLGANRPVSKDHLIDELWKGDPPPSALGTIHSLVYRLRRLFESTSRPDDVALERTPTGYLLRLAESAVDVYEFERACEAGRQALENGDAQTALDELERGLGLWRGDAFAGIDVTEVRHRAAALDDQRLTATEWRMTAQLELGAHHALLSELEQATTRHPFRERFWELLMTVLHRCGRRADALEAYQRLYRLLDEELGIEPSPAVRELHQQILSGVQELDSAPPVSRPATVPRLLPVAVREFTGRGQQLKTLDTLLPDRTMPDSATATIAVISGMAGIGKTALAVHWAHLHADQFPDGQLYLNLRGFDPVRQPTSPAGALRGMIQALGVDPQRIPDEVEARIALYRGLLAGTRTLVILDNAVDEGQVRPLLPGAPGCLTVITSRNHLSGLVAAEAAHPLPLDLLPQAEAYELVARRIGHDRVAAEAEAAESIIDSCACLPLALAVASARAATHPGLPLSRFARELRQSERGLDALASRDPTTDIRTVFSWSFDQLTPDAAQLFRLFGLHPGPHLSRSAAASLLGRPVRQVGALLDDLVSAHLMTELPDDRYTAHDLLRLYARELADTSLPAPERQAATHRLLDHYTHTAYAASRLIAPARTSVDLGPHRSGVCLESLAGHDEAMAWLATERRGLLAAVDHAVRAGFDTHGWQLAVILADFLTRQGHWHDEAAALEAALEAAQRLGDRHVLSRIHRFLASAYVQLQRDELTHGHMQRALELAEQLDDPQNLAETHRHIGMVLMRQGRYAETLPHAEVAFEQYELAGDLVGQARSLSAMGWCHTQLDQHEQAADYCRRALDLLQQTGDRQGEAHTWDSLGHALHHLGDHHRAIRYYNRSLELHQELGERYYYAITLTHLAEAEHTAGNRERAFETWRRALRILEELEHPTAQDVRNELKKRREPRDRTRTED